MIMGVDGVDPRHHPSSVLLVQLSDYRHSVRDGVPVAYIPDGHPLERLVLLVDPGIGE